MKKWTLSIAVIFLAGALIFSGCAARASTAKAALSQADLFSVKVKLTNAKEDKILVQTAIPEFSGFEAATELNAKISKLAQDGITQLKENTKDLGDTAGADDLFYSSFFDYSRNNDLLSVWITSENYSGGAHGMHWVNSFTVNTKTGVSYSTPGALFQDDSIATKWLTGQISQKIEAQKDAFFPEAQQTLTDKKGKYSYYLDGGTLVVYFDLYELLPYAGGIPTFEFPIKDFAGNGLPLNVNLADEKRRGSVRLNGADVTLKNKVVSNDEGVFLPLEETAALLGKTVTEQQGKYAVDGKAAEVKQMNGIPYAPLIYFTQTLGELLVYDDTALRVFPKAQDFVTLQSQPSTAGA